MRDNEYESIHGDCSGVDIENLLDRYINTRKSMCRDRIDKRSKKISTNNYEPIRFLLILYFALQHLVFIIISKIIILSVLNNNIGYKYKDTVLIQLLV